MPSNRRLECNFLRPAVISMEVFNWDALRVPNDISVQSKTENMKNKSSEGYQRCYNNRVMY